MMEVRMRGPNPRPVRRRFAEKYVVDASGCWIWTGKRDRKGYGRITVGSRSDGTRRTCGAHRVAWELYNGSVPNGGGHHGTCVCHRCDNPSCVNPNHLFLGSNADNVADMVAKGRAVGGGRRGEANVRAKLSAAEVASIRSLAGTMTQREIGERFGIRQSHVSEIISGKIWRDGVGGVR